MNRFAKITKLCYTRTNKSRSKSFSIHHHINSWFEKRERPYVSQLGTDFRGDDTVLSTCFHNHPYLLVPCILYELLLGREEPRFSATVPTQQQTASCAILVAWVSIAQGVEEFIREGFWKQMEIFNGIFHEKGGGGLKFHLSFFQIFFA